MSVWEERKHERENRERAFKDSESVSERGFIKDFPTVTHSVPWKAFNINSQVNLSCSLLGFVACNKLNESISHFLAFRGENLRMSLGGFTVSVG